MEPRRKGQGSVITTILVLILSLLPATSSAFLDVSGPIAGDTTWTNADVIRVTGTLTVLASGHLTIQPGTVVLFNPNTRLQIGGRLTAEGSRSERIVFSSSADTAGGSPTAGGWSGLFFDTGGDGAMRNCNVLYADVGVQIYLSSPAFDSCVVEDFLAYGFSVDGVGSSPEITPVVEHCTIRQRDAALVGTAVGIHAYRSVSIVISRSLVSDCRIGVEFYGYGSRRPQFLVANSDICSHAEDAFYILASG